MALVSLCAAAAMFVVLVYPVVDILDIPARFSVQFRRSFCMIRAAESQRAPRESGARVHDHEGSRSRGFVAEGGS